MIYKLDLKKTLQQTLDKYEMESFLGIDAIF